MKIVALFALAGLIGCSSAVQTETITLKMPAGYKLKAGEQAPQITMFAKQFDIFTAVCGAVVQYSSGEPGPTIPGSCNTPLGLVMGAPMNAGLAAAVAAAIK